MRAIRDDEARHVAVSRGLALAQGSGRAVRDAGAATRAALADTMALVGPAFDRLSVDPSRLIRDVRSLPDGLLRA